MTHDSKEPAAALAGLEEDLVLEQADFDRFAALSGDHNPIHVDPDYAAGTRFGATVSHGMLLFTALRGLIERHYPGATLETQNLMFPAPAFAGEPLRMRLDALSPASDDRLELATRVERPDGQFCLQGQCRIKLHREERP